MDVREFDFELPPELIAQEPPRERDGSRLLHLDRASGAIQHTRITALPDLLRDGDLVVVNDTRVFPARLLGRRVPSGGAVECLLIRSLSAADPIDAGGQSAGDLVENGKRSEADRRGSRLRSDVDQVKVGSEADAHWEALMHPGQKLKPGTRVVFEGIHT